MVRFADVELDVQGRVLLRAGQVVHVEPQAFDLLVLLLEHRDRVLSKPELLDGVWGHRFVSEANLTTRIKEIRRAVGDDGVQQHTIKNIRGRGYRFVADVAILAPPRGERSALGLVGREHEIGVLLDRIVVSPLVTLIGPGGVGKSTLARAVSDRAAASFADGVCMVELSALDHGEHVLPAVARALGVVLDIDRPERSIRSIAELDVLLVLDNCEHVGDDVGALLERLAAVRGARLVVLATSQVRLGLSHEQVIAVQPLSVGEALELFAVRAAAVRPTFDLDDTGRDRVARLLAGLDQLPLTIEMAAARLGSMNFDELEHAMSADMPMPVTHRSPVRRHRSLDSLVSWSAELLDAPLRRTFTEFAVFAGAVSAGDAMAVVGGGPELIVDLAALAERSLLVADLEGRATRYSMLSTVRSVAARWLEESSTAEDVRRRHAEHFVEAARKLDRQIRGPGEADGRRRLDDIANELRSAHRWARDHQPELASAMCGALHLAAYSTFWNEPAEWSRSLLALHPEGGLDGLMGARIVLVGVDANRGRLAEARAVATELMQAADVRVRSAALELMTDISLYDGRLAEVASFASELRRLGLELDDPHALAIAAVNAALALAYTNDTAGALATLDELDPRVLSPSDRAWLVYAQGEAWSAAGDPQAKDAYASAIELARAIGNPFVTSVALVSLATEHARAGEHPQALDAYALCLQDYARQGNFVHAVTTLRNLVEVLVALGDDHGAATLAAATFGGQRPSYGVETARLSAVIAGVAERAGADDFAAWTAEGQQLDLPQAVGRAVDLVAHHRGGSSDSPHTIPQQPRSIDGFIGS